VRWGRSI